MPDNITPANERTVIVNPNRLGILTLVSLCFNALILLLLLIGVVCHHHRPKPPGPDQQSSGDRGWGRGGCEQHSGMRSRHREFGDMHHGWGRGRGFDRGGDRDRGWDRGYWSKDDGSGWGGGRDEGRGGGPGEFRGGPEGHGFGGPGDMMPMMMQPPTQTELTDHIMHHLTDVLSLTDQENSQIRPVIEQQVADLQKDMDAERQARVKSVDDTTAKIRPMLTADQQKLLDQMKADEEQKMNPPAQGQPAAADQAKPKGA